MSTIISWMVRLTVIAGVLVSLQSFAVRHFGQVKNASNRTAATARGDKGNLPPATSGAMPELAGVGIGLPGYDLASTVLTLMPQSAGQTGPSTPAAPQQPSMLIRYTEPAEKSDNSSRTAVMQLPPGTKAIIVDGRVQIYHPSGQQKEKKATKRAVAGGRKPQREESRDAIDLGAIKDLDMTEIAKLLGQGQ